MFIDCIKADNCNETYTVEREWVCDLHVPRGKGMAADLYAGMLAERI